jgi:nucleoside-diphosphate-sugar epimerase
VRRAVKGIDVVQHCAALGADHSTAEELRETNIGGLRQLLGEARRARVGRVVLLSSVNVLGTLDLDPATEDLPYRWSHDPAADVTIMAELVAQDEACRPGPEIVILRPGFIYGPGESRNLPRLIKAVQRSRFAFIGSRNHVIPIVHVGDVVQAMLLAVRVPEPKGRIYLISDGSRTTVGQFIDHLAGLLRCFRPRRVLPGFLPRFACAVFDGLRPVYPRCPAPISRSEVRFLGTSCHVDIARAREALGYAPRIGYREGLAEVVRGFSVPAWEKRDEYSLSRS